MSSYDYYADAKIRHTYDSADHTFDRSQEYDHAGRLKEAYSGREVTGQLPTVPADNPYRQTYQYDVWNNQTEKSGRFWRNSQYSSTPHVNNRGGAFGYDAEGNGVILSGNNRAAYDAANKETNFINWQWTVGGSPNHPNQQPIAEITQSYDGDGQPPNESSCAGLKS